MQWNMNVNNRKREIELEIEYFAWLRKTIFNNIISILNQFLI